MSNTTATNDNKRTWLFDILESEETSGSNEGKSSPSTDGAETLGGACGTTADEIPGTLMKLGGNVLYRLTICYITSITFFCNLNRS